MGVPCAQFVDAVMGRWPNAVLQFEDFNMEHAAPLLDRYRNHHLVFNDDIQVPLLSPVTAPHTWQMAMTATVVHSPRKVANPWPTAAAHPSPLASSSLQRRLVGLSRISR